MSLEAKKLGLIERFMKLKHEQTILKLEAYMTDLEMNARADTSEQDISHGKTRTYSDFSNEVSQWLKNKNLK